MPKFLAGKVVVRTFEVWADSPEDARAAILKWQEGETEEPEGGVKVTRYKLGWEEFNESDPTPMRDQVLAEFLRLMQDQIPGIPIVKESRIIKPFDRITNPPPSPRSDGS